MSENLFTDMSVWDVVGNLSLSVMIGTEAFAAIGAVIWALLYYTGLFKFALYGGLAIGAASGVFSAIWIFRLALKQRHIQAREREGFAAIRGE